MAEPEAAAIPRLLAKYREEVVPDLMKVFGYGNLLQVPRLLKVVLNMGVGDAVRDAKVMDRAAEELALISGQKPVIRKARKSIASFKLRTGMPIGACVTLRRHRMWEFYDRLTNVALPRIRDFRGLSDKGFDGRGNFSLGLTEQLVFPEIPYDKVEKVRGLSVTIVTSARTDEEAKVLLQKLGMPFRG